mmetsp:Transcript_40520/g.106389  ORF Transcript_40520/g.106389 Transcript_40520/m.106389 type:complete len:372 (-) Transcript_40520:121-1236(-)
MSRGLLVALVAGLAAGGKVTGALRGGAVKAGDEQPWGSTKVGIVTVTKEPANIQRWFQYHLAVGFDHIYLQVEGTPWIDDIIGKPEFVHKITYWRVPEPNVTDNYNDLQSRQRIAVQYAVQLATAPNARAPVDWLLHIDDDELFYVPGHPVGVPNVKDLFESVPKTYRSVKFRNSEAVYPSAEVKDCFKESTLFRRNGATSYANGKSAGRTAGRQAIMPFGPHDFDVPNPAVVLDTSVLPTPPGLVLHFESCPFSRWENKFWSLRKTPAQSLKNIPFPFYRESIWLMNKCGFLWGGRLPSMDEQQGTNATVAHSADPACHVDALKRFWSSYKVQAQAADTAQGPGYQEQADTQLRIHIDWAAIEQTLPVKH